MHFSPGTVRSLSKRFFNCGGHSTSLFLSCVTDNMVGPGRTYKPVQGGFLVLRPDKKVYEEYVRIIKKGIEKEGTGWGGLVGPFYGFMTFQGKGFRECVGWINSLLAFVTFKV